MPKEGKLSRRIPGDPERQLSRSHDQLHQELVAAAGGGAAAPSGGGNTYVIQSDAGPRACVMCLGIGTPVVTGPDWMESVVPYDPTDGTTPITWNVRRIDFRVSTAGGSPSVTVEKSTGAGAFAGVAVGTVTLGAEAYEASKVSAFDSGTVQSGDKVRVNVMALGVALGWVVELTLEENA